jgi:hypothetical protein
MDPLSFAGPERMLRFPLLALNHDKGIGLPRCEGDAGPFSPVYARTGDGNFRKTVVIDARDGFQAAFPV